MATVRAPRPKVTTGDRLSLTVFFAVVVHSLIILGISFNPDLSKPRQKLPGLEVTLVQSKTDKDIKDADFLAQANQEGGGDTPKKVRPSSPVTPVIPTGETGDVKEVVTETKIPTTTQPTRKKILTAESSSAKISSGLVAPQTQDQENLTPAQLLSRSKEIARLSAEIDQTQRVFAHMPRRQYISARTKEYRFASYEEAWRAKVERIGRINFPDEAKRQKLSGSLIMAVTINADGSIKSINIRQSSGHKILDDGAVRIVKLAAPFARFPKNISKDTDEIVITRTWVFEAGQRFTAH